MLYDKPRIAGFQFDKLWHPPMSYYITQQDVIEIYNISRSAKLNALPLKKYGMVDEILKRRGFTRLHAGTNRLVYKSEYDSSICLKIGIDIVGREANVGEYHTQELLKPFCTKVFEVTPCGTVAMVERVNPIKNRFQFEDVGDIIFNIIIMQFAGIVLEDVGTNFFMNWGIREGFGPVVLDFPYAYEADITKLHCIQKDKLGVQCNGLIDYDDGCNTLVCEACGRRHTAKSLAKNNGAILITKDYLNQRGRRIMQLPKVQIKRRDGSTYGDDLPVNVKEDVVMKRHIVYNKELKVNVNLGHNHDKIMAQVENSKPHNNFQSQQKMIQRGDSNNAENVNSNTRSIVNRSSVNCGTPVVNDNRECNEQGRDLLKEAAVFMDILGYKDISGRLKRMSHFKDGDEINVEVNDFKQRCRRFTLREFSDIEVKKSYDFDSLDKKYFNPKIPFYNQIDKENDSIDVVECKLKAIDAWYLEEEEKSKTTNPKSSIPDINDPNAVWVPSITHKASDEEPVDPQLMANQLYIDRSIEKAIAGGEMKVKIKKEDPEEQKESTDKDVSVDISTVEEDNHETEYFDKKEVALSDTAEDVTSATDRAKIIEFMMNETSDFLDGIEKDSVSNNEIKTFVQEYLTEQCLKKYSKSDPEVLKVMVKEFVEENNMDIVGTDSYETEKKEATKAKSISIEELRNIEY